MIITGEKCCIPARLPSLRNRREEKEERAVAIWLCWLAFLALQTGMRRAKPSQAVELLKCFHKRSSASRFCYFFLHPLAHSFVRLLARSLLRPDSSTSEKTKSANIWTAPFKISIAAKKEREFHLSLFTVSSRLSLSPVQFTNETNAKSEYTLYSQSIRSHARAVISWW